MTYDPNREAARLRIIIETLAHANPDMPMSEAAGTIFAIEEKAAKLESSPTPTPGKTMLRDSLPHTVSVFINSQSDIQQLIIDGKKINAIKEVRARTLIGLKEAKEGVEFWHRHYTGPF